MGWFVFGIVMMAIFLIAQLTKLSFKGSARKLRKELESEKDNHNDSNIKGRLADDESFATIARVVSYVTFGLGVLFAVLSCVRVVPANNVGIPTTNGNIGAPMNSGLQVVLPWTEIHEFSTRVQELSMLRAPDEGDKKKDDSIDAIAKAGGSMKIDLTVRYFVKEDQAGTLFRQAGTMDLIKETFVRPDAREVSRNVFSQYTAEEGYSSKRAEISAQIAKDLAPRLAARGIVLDSVNVRDVLPEAQVLNAINAILQTRNDALKAAEDQNKQVTEAETRKQVAQRDKDAAITKAQADAQAITINADAQAAANQKIAASLTPELARLKAVLACADAIAQTKAAVVNTCGDTMSSSGGSTNAASTVIVDGRPKA